MLQIETSSIISGFKDGQFLSNLQRLGPACTSQYESYCLSPAYFEYTGRRGIWMSQSESSLVVFCRHPNDDRKILIFPEISREGSYELTNNLIANADFNKYGLQLSRFTDEQHKNFLSFMATRSKRHIKINCMPETRLDWGYPVNILSTSALTVRNTSGFTQLRQRLRKIDAGALYVQTIDISSHRQGIRDLLAKWASKYKHVGYSLNDLISPSQKLFTILENNLKFFGGQVIFIDGVIESFCLWENPVLPGLPANALAMISSHDRKGLSEWQIVLMCEQLNAEAVPLVNIGGSETLTLDRFKRKFAPYQRIPLFSLEIKPSN
jgi:hypothetical protein